MPSDLQHLQRYASTGDAHAFRELVQAHGAMVHATALRVTRDAAAAQDVAQETFLELARKAGGITQSVAAWLHRVAWNRACDAVRRESTRKRVEEAMAETWHTDREATWPDIEPHVDASLNELPNELREVLVLYFLEGRTQAEVARHLGKNQATVSRAIERGIFAMREALRSRGVIAGAGLVTLFAAQSAQAMPVAVQVSLGKLSLTGIGTSSAIPAASVTTTLITMTDTTKALLVTGTLAAVSLPFVLPRTEKKLAPVSPPTVTKAIATNPISKSNPAEISDQEMFNLLFGGSLAISVVGDRGSRGKRGCEFGSVRRDEIPWQQI
jgi:RNA polymerase sigma factor (sigma-70 family)